MLTAAAGALGAALVGVGMGALTSPADAAPKCTINFSSSADRVAVGQNITLTWKTSGADQLIASWTTAKVPFSGTQVTTKDTPGTTAYQVTGLYQGQYCGGAAVNVAFVKASAPSTAATPSSSPAPSTTAAAPSSSTPVATVAPSESSSAAPYPTQSGTGGSGVPWYEQPGNLLALGLVSLVSSLALFNRERVSAVFARRH